ncbi:bifunctional 4-hydroxy-2-oxoglutarate aldolase/2-dehydro-3-deoxy-phosphogluconate aldolase [Kitasatospora sp. NBC_01287]|uniref:bifunctional 4-hydroxy-2-oxoglutarate aldolase/2-dehydro-3-deoxy-phosphogluconate aldolase n=1 Tax=Kitasatospora sp. NBC_01287 TaxID=2903573 RepID=UPI00225884E0|nr:bifunctional 4-hydroxy-2-oxoglutarate aldolase/2-dehydro-3-deoxy-phosphogluconate aldolase [Kitasatospora sp. NBC_01287]MCX4744870.1 bifunctional 4-hydroxy-2-oxoglutarate aldolase/2-dehydro-3-deoxy-phosphogluconate aldolase [Kitasatospora sp. NBC_01287]
MTFQQLLARARVIAVVRAPLIPDAAALCAALVAGGIHWVELTCTTPEVTRHLARAAGAGTGARLGLGTVLSAEQAEAGIEAGAEYLVTPGCRAPVAEAARAAAVPVLLGALTPTEVAHAVDLGAAAVKVFPARAFGPGYFKDLHGPYPGLPLVASGGVDAASAPGYLAAGAVAVCAGGEVVPAAAVAAGDWPELTRRAAAFMAALAS